jgi:hypothetical protein
MKAMTGHVSDEALAELLEEAGSAADREHAASCPACGTRLSEARAELELARSADVPEPSPLYWEAFRRNVGRRIAEEPGPRWRWGLWVPLATVAAAAAFAVAVVVRTPGPTAAERAAGLGPSPVVPAWSALPPAEEDVSLDVMEGLAVADGGLTAWAEGRGLGAFVGGLTDEESAALAETLRKAGEGEL